MLMPEHAAPSTALPLGSTRILSPTRLTRVDPTGPAHAVRLLNTVLAIVAINSDDRIPKVKPGQPEIKVEETKDAVKVEEGAEGEAGEAGEAAGAGAGAPEGGTKVEGDVEGTEDEGQGEGVTAEDEDDEDEDEVPYREEIGWREVLGFIVM
jgi:polyribonucleotide 5'-hydroxyl-kinase